MEIREIIKDALIFPTRNLETLSIYAILSILSAAFLTEGIITCIFGIVDIINLVIGIIFIIIAIIIGLLTRRISIDCIKSGIEFEDKLPDFIWWKSFGTGISKVIITIFYFIIPLLIVILIAIVTNVFGGIMTLVEEILLLAPNALIQNSGSFSDAVYNAALPLFISLTITISLGLIIFLIFSFFQVMAESRLANTGSLKTALNVIGAARDIKRIGVLKLVLLSVIIYIIAAIFGVILTILCDHLLFLSLLSIVITPYLVLFSQRCFGLLYSDIV
jgi:hypothetical protein